MCFKSYIGIPKRVESESFGQFLVLPHNIVIGGSNVSNPSKMLLCGIAAITALVLVMYGPVAYGQVSRGSISGTLVDQQGAAVPDAILKVVNKETNQESATTSNAEGLFRVPLLAVGTYRVEISKPGFRKAVFSDVVVSVGVDRGMGIITLELGEVTASVEVSAALPLVESTQAQVTNSFVVENLTTFPGVLENQGLDNLALTVPGVVNNRDLGFSNTNGTGFAVNGLRGRNNDQQIDGQNNNDNSVGGPGLFVSNPEFVQEYQITTSNFGPEYGRNSGSVVNLIIKSGTNDYHGSVVFTESNSALDALSNSQKQFQKLSKPARYNDAFGTATIGGPIIKDRMFFFGGFDYEKIAQSQVFSSGLLTPTPAGIATMAACFPTSTSIQALETHGPYAITGGNPTPQSPTIVNLTNCAGVQMGGVQRLLPTGAKLYDFPIKLDLHTAKNQFYGRYLYNKSTFFNTNAFGTAAAGYPADVPALSQAYGFSWVRTISTRMSNEFRASYGRLNVQFGGNSIGNTIPPMASLDQALARITFSSSTLLPFGPATNSPQGRIVNTYQLQDNWNYLLGRHTLKAGVNFTYQRSPNKFLPNFNGEFRFSNWNSFGRNTPNRIRIASGDPSLDFREKDTFVYFGDDFKIKNNLILNLGITWSYYGQPANLFHDRTVAKQTGSSPLWDPTLPLSVTTFPSIPAPNDSFGPSIGFAWTPTGGGKLTGEGKTVLRGGYRLAYDPPYYNIYLNISTAAPNVLLNTLLGTSASGNPLPANPIGPNVRTQLASFLLTGIFDPRRFNFTNITPDFGPQRVHSWSFGLQREVARDVAVEARYVGNHATRLFQSINGNPRIDGLRNLFPSLVPAGMTPCPLSSLSTLPVAVENAIVGRANCNLGVVRSRTNTAYSDYNGLQAELRANRLWQQLNIKASYTFSKTTDNASEIFSTFGAGGTLAWAQSQVNFTNQEHGTSGLDFPHNFVVTVVEEIPLFKNRSGILHHTLGGWAVAGTYFISSGQPFTPVQGALSCFSGGLPCSGAGVNNPYDPAFNGSFVGADGALRPFIGSNSAPANTVGIFAGDACSIFAFTGSEPVCLLPATALISLNSLNPNTATPVALAGYTPAVVTSSAVRFIANTPGAVTAFGTPFGNAGRNILRDYWTNLGNFTLFKTVKVKERFGVTWHMTMQNVFNHPNFFSIDPFIDDAGLTDDGTGFANPSLFSGGLQNATGIPGRTIKFGIKLAF